jgi:hypothetical protein
MANTAALAWAFAASDAALVRRSLDDRYAEPGRRAHPPFAEVKAAALAAARSVAPSPARAHRLRPGRDQVHRAGLRPGMQRPSPKSPAPRTWEPSPAQEPDPHDRRADNESAWLECLRCHARFPLAEIRYQAVSAAPARQRAAPGWGKGVGPKLFDARLSIRRAWTPAALALPRGRARRAPDEVVTHPERHAALPRGALCDGRASTSCASSTRARTRPAPSRTAG